MKRIYFLIILMFTTSILFSQQWLNNLPKNKTKNALTLFDYKNAFNSYWAPYNVKNGYYTVNGVKKKAPGWKQFKRWEYDMENQVNPTTGAFPTKTAQKVYEEYKALQPALKMTNAANWVSMGSNSSAGGYAGIGRINCIAFHPTDNNTYWVGAASGGLWVTTNNGSSWTCLTDNNGVLAVSDIVIPTDYATSNTIYIATGDRDHWDNRSIGVLKSTNGGTSWNATALSYTLANNTMVYRLLLDPNNNQNIIAATSNGVYKTTNGGTAWNTQLTANAYIDMEYKPGDFNTLYGSTQSGSIYVSSNGGTSWTQAYSNSSAYRIELAVSANQATWVYAIACGSDYGLYAILKSTNSGTSYSQVYAGTSSNLLGWYSDGSDAGGQGTYDLSMAVSPTNASIVLIGGVNSHKSTNGGTSWTCSNCWTSSSQYNFGSFPAVHADKHCLKFRSNGDLFECNDGGVYISSNSGTSWTDKTNGMTISQIYKLGVSQTVSNEVITGLQDNGTKLLSGGSWADVKGGDGTNCIIDYTNVNIQYGAYVYGQISRTTDHWSSTTDISANITGTPSGAWVTPYIIDPVNSQTLYAGYADVWKTTNRGDTWTKISTINTSTNIRSMAIAPSNTQVLYVAATINIWKTINGGTAWTDITGTLPVSSGNITNITVKNDDANTVWVTFSGYNATRVYQTTNGGTTWTDISTGLPALPAYSLVQNKQSTTEVQLYVATELGVYYKKGTANWVAFNTGLPNVRIGEIEIYYDANPQNSKLRAATYGRGLWETPVDYASVAMTYVSSTTTQNNVTTVAPGQTNQQVIGVEIVMNGSLTPLSATSFTFNTTGTTNATTDITNAKLYYTGASNTIATTTQFGTTTIAPNGTFTITGSQVLSDGTNYFWLTYDLPSTATIGDVIDAQCTSLTIGTVKTPTITNPSGNRTIAIVYCTAGATTCDEYIANVTIGTINNSTACTNGGYADYSTLSTNIAQGASLALSITNGSVAFPSDLCGIWVDWNNNGNFTDDAAVTISGSPGTGPYTANITCPASTPTGSKRMRIRIHYTDETTDPCGNATYGEVEDYSLNVINSCTPPTTQATAFTSSALAGTTMTVGWTRGNGNSVLIVARQGSAVNSNPVNGITYSANAAFGSGTQIGTGNYVVYNGSGTSVNLTALTSGTAYYYAIYEYNSTTYCYKTPALTGNASTTVVPTLSVAPSSQNVNYTAGSTTFAVTSTVAWTAVSNQTWCTVTPSGTGSGTLTANYTANGSPSSRTATITVSGTGVNPVNVTVIQSGVSSVIWSSNMNTSSVWTVALDPSATLATQWVWIQDTAHASSFFKQYVHPDLFMKSPTAGLGVFYFDAITNLVNSNYGIENSTLTNTNPISTLGHNSVILKYYQLYKSFNYDTTFIEISSNNSTWTRIMANPDITTGHANTYDYGFKQFNITQWAGNKAQVWIRFRFTAPATTANGALYSGGYGWMIDDVSLEDAPNNKIDFTDIWAGSVGLTSSAVWSGYTQIPSGQSFPVTFAASIKNMGGLSQTNVKLKAKDLTTGTIKSSTNLSSMAVSELDTLQVIVDTLNTIGTYNYTLYAVSDSISSSLYKDTLSIIVNNKTQGLYSRDDNYYNGYRRWNGVTGTSVDAYQMANLVEVTTNDPIFAKSISFVVGSGTTVNAPVKAILYRGAGQSKIVVAESNYHYILASEIANTVGSAPPAIELYFTDYSNQKTKLLKDSSYYVAVQAFGGSDSVWLAVGNSKTPQPDYAMWIYDTDNMWYYYPRGSAPAMIRLNTMSTNIIPANAGVITGATTVCAGQSSVIYTVPAITNATSYIWTLPSGASGSSTTNSITVNYSASAVAGNITVKGHNAYGDGAASTLAITINPLPTIAGTITGLTSICQGQTAVTYTVPTITNATTYVWTLPTGASGTSSTNSISVNYSASAVSGNITVKGNNTCGVGAISTLPITVASMPVAAGSITGLTIVCQGQNAVTYTVPTITNATSYIWTLPSGYTGTSTTNSISINYAASAVSGSISVKGHSACGDGTASSLNVTVNVLPVSAGTITGLTSLCQGQNNISYIVPPITNATTYIWTLPTGVNGTSTTDTITVNYTNTSVSGTITVKGHNSCGDGSVASLPVTVNPLPVQAGTIVGASTVCMGQSSVVNTYNVASITNASTYFWTLPSGANGSSSTNSISVTFNTSASSGNLTVKGQNACGDGIQSAKAITVNPIPQTPVITLNGSTLSSDASAGNQWYNLTNGIVLNATSQTYMPQLTGNYFVIVTVGGCLSDSSNVIYFDNTGIEVIDNNRTIKVYPNPVSNELYIEITGNKHEIAYEIYNSIGQVVANGKLIEKTVIHTSDFAQGVYLIKLDNGKTFEFKKILKE